MLKKKERLTTTEFNKVFATGQRRHSVLLQLIYAKGEVFHGAAVVGKKVFKKAVDRNRLRRRIYNILYRLSKDGELQGTFILIAKPACKEASFTDLRADIDQLLSKF